MIRNIKLAEERADDADSQGCYNSLFELEELLEQRLENVPKGTESMRTWRKEVNKMVEEINEVIGWNKHKRV